MSTCPACLRLERARQGDDPFFLAALRESVVLLHKHQRYPGWCSLWLSDHAEHLALLPRERQDRLWADVADVARALHAALDLPDQPVRINYENLGNVVHHIHWHLIPRRPSDPDPRATIWVRPSAETDCGCDDTLRDALVTRLRATLAHPRSRP
jgi:diadenosine tetraphosphate (Ap4A) HIT family hydrolase